MKIKWTTLIKANLKEEREYMNKHNKKQDGDIIRDINMCLYVGMYISLYSYFIYIYYSIFLYIALTTVK